MGHALQPYWENVEHGLTIYHGDALEVMPQLDETFDLCLTDPPYGVGFDYQIFDDTKDNVRELVTRFVPIAQAISNRVMVTTGQSNMFSYPQPTWVLCWTVPSGTGIGPWGFNCWHPIFCYGNDPYQTLGLGGRPDAICQQFLRDKEDYGHPCPKPLGLMMWLLNRGSVEGSIIDPFLGSGTSLVAAYHAGVCGVGVELNEEYCEVAASRLEREIAQ